MLIRKNYQLKDLNTFRLPCLAKKYIRLENIREADDIAGIIKTEADKFFILGGGSNILFANDFKGTVIHPSFKNISISDIDHKYAIISAEAGLEWDELVKWSVDNNLGGLENLSLIPGSVGAAPVQNIGAYGSELSDIFHGLKAVSVYTAEEKSFTREDCRFGYRDSIFKNELKNKYIITSVEFKLRRNPDSFNLSYGNLEKTVNESGNLSLAEVRKAVIKIRKEKLPDPSETGNAGSFFKNPVLSNSRFTELKSLYPGIPSWELGDGSFKIPAAWLIENAGWKGKKHGNAAVHDNHALILINTGNAMGKEILELSDKISASVRKKFGIILSPEVNVI